MQIQQKKGEVDIIDPKLKIMYILNKLVREMRTWGLTQLASSNGSDEYAHMRILSRVIAARIHKIWKQTGAQSKKEAKDQESIQSGTTPDPGYQLESNKFTIRHH